jgi:hypothetical protein
MITKRREEERQARINMLFADAIQPIVRLFQRNRKWRRFLRVADQIRLQLLRRRMAKRVQRMIRHFLVRAQLQHCIRVRAERKEAARIKALHTWACGIIGKYVRRRRELYSLRTRFDLRRLVSE